MFTGSIVALITPMDLNGAVDRMSLKKLVDHHVVSGTSAIVSVGTTGEMSGLTHEEHVDVVMRTLEFSDGRIPIIAGTGANSTAEAVALTNKFNDSDIAACLSVTPYYNCPNQEGLFQHFKAISESTELPQILYNVPVRTGCDMLPVTVARLSNIKNIVGIKEATGNLNRVNQLKQLVHENFILLSGDDLSALDFMQLGGGGVISVTANIAAKEMAELCKLANENDFLNAQYINQRLIPVHQALFIDSNPIPVKWACKELGLISHDAARLPMTALSAVHRDVLKKVLIDSGLF
ncbi:4-hydroxy-tetrahydrodipicolinate synthase [Blochmannia endosymbiont of Camponotus sp. C-003]|uniref:4-hydroxy-tetrahydrodipicolinate synthase n=1 Tax=unclassified Candidatus Blochmanniella TaxID=711328 RepID=UPI0020253538|nr:MULTISPECIES: 4-hydroxy-tetrahydrodipicolinate synthase [unclassified Candidatus Blochmannia]URJ23319.1 4-hydroxy-tetrahydrodipicolinate synthase [Blochmannia endosymbiont of Camponotus sp. C-003]URJ28792.1 4-hydroxy-tetrahydrodipicolinate synthase [Blochmannia endosymbiont of Camponotus sp. C-046]